LGSNDFSRMLHSSITGYYFVLEGGDGAILIDSTDLTFTAPSSDTHTLTYIGNGYFYYRNVRTSMSGGGGFVSGENNDNSSTQIIRIENLTALTPLPGWIATHPNYHGIHVRLYSPYPASTPNFYSYNSGTSADTWVCHDDTGICASPDPNGN